jgi:hypothetical protein
MRAETQAYKRPRRWYARQSVTVIDFSELQPASPPALALGFRPELVRAVKEADAILREHGAVSDGKGYELRHRARWRAQRMISLLVDQGVRERWEVRERTWFEEDGFHWSVQYTGGEQNGGDGAER